MTNQTGRPANAAAPTAPTRHEAAGAAFGVAALTGHAATAEAADSAAAATPSPSPGMRPKPRIRRTTVSQRMSTLQSPPAALPSPPGAAAPAPGNRDSELRDWTNDNARLLSNASLLISIAALAIGFLPGEGWIEPYIQAILFGAAFLLLLELHNQWPEDLQIHRLRSMSMPAEHSWRMSGFAFLVQLATVLFVVWAAVTSPLIFIPLTAVAIVFLFRRFVLARLGGRFARVVSILSLILVLLISELLILIVYAAVTGEKITIQLWTEERPNVGTHVEIGN